MRQRMLRALSGRTHEVLTAVALRDRRGRRCPRSAAAKSRFASIDAERSARLLGIPARAGDKAGAYAIQGYGAVFIADLRGSYSGVMGLPLFETARVAARRPACALAERLGRAR